MPNKNINQLKSQLDFIVEVDKMKHIYRQTLLIDGSRRENDAEHSWHIALAAMILKEYADFPINMEHVLQMLIVHDLVEIYAGDTFAFDVEANKKKYEREQLAADKLFSRLPNAQGVQIRALWEEFDAMQTFDSIFAASLDRLQPFLHNIHTNGHTWKKAVITKKAVINRMLPIQTGMPLLWEWVLAEIEKAIQLGWIKE